MMRNTFAFDNILAVMSSQDKTLPPLWAVIYYESVRGHHMLFEHSDIIAARAISAKNEPTSQDDLERICEAVVTIISRSDLQAMRQTIRMLPATLRARLFIVYQHFVSAYKQHRKSNLN